MDTIMRRFEAGFSGLAVLALAFVAGSVDAHAQPAPADVAGPWTIQSVQPAPWAPRMAPDRQLVGASIAFNDGRMAGPNAFTCGSAKYEVVQSEPRGLFQGGLAEATAERDAAALGIPKLTTTYRINCDTGSFDFHKAGGDLVIGYDNQILRMRRGAR